MKILYGITKSNFGGAQRYVFDLAREAKRLGHDVAVLAGGDEILIDKLKEQDIRVIPLPNLGRDISPLDDARSLFFMMNLLYEEKPDVFHINSSKMGGLGAFTARVAGVKKIIFTSHGWAFNEPRPVWQKFLVKFFVWLTLLFSHKIICVSENTARDISHLPFIKEKLKLVRNGIEEFNLWPRDRARGELGVHEDDALLVGALSELHPVKGLDILLYAWSEFSKRNGHAYLVIIGAGDEREFLGELADSLNVSDSVIFKGFVDNARALLSGFDIFVMPSRSEAFPYAPIEAGAAGLPVIATSVGGIPEIIESGTSGILIPPEDPDALLSSLILLTQDKTLRSRLGATLKHAVSEKFSKEKMLRETFAIYQ